MPLRRLRSFKSSGSPLLVTIEIRMQHFMAE